jgi:hypothetical protein
VNPRVFRQATLFLSQRHRADVEGHRLAIFKSGALRIVGWRRVRRLDEFESVGIPAARWCNAATFLQGGVEFAFEICFFFSARASAASAFTARSVSAVLPCCCAPVVSPVDAFTFAVTDAFGAAAFARSAFTFGRLGERKKRREQKKNHGQPAQASGGDCEKRRFPLRHKRAF